MPESPGNSNQADLAIPCVLVTGDVTSHKTRNFCNVHLLRPACTAFFDPNCVKFVAPLAIKLAIDIKPGIAMTHPGNSF